MTSRIIIALVTMVISQFAIAERQKEMSLGNDLYSSGDHVIVDKTNLDSIFIAGESIHVNTNISGSAHVAGQNINLRENIGNSVFAMGQSINIDGDVGSDAYLAGQSILISGAVGNDIRAAGETVYIDADIGGDAALAGESVKISKTIAGSVSIAAEDVIFTPEARIHGTLTIYSDDPELIHIPESLIHQDRVTLESYDSFEDFDEMTDHDGGDRDRSSPFIRFVLLSLLLFGIATLFRNGINNSFDRGWQGFWKSVGHGVLAYSAIVGSAIVLGLTIIGLPLSLLMILASVLLWMLAYIIGNYLIVSRIWKRYREEVPSSYLHIAIVSVLSALSAGIVANIPGLGWWLMIAITLFGVGALAPWRVAKSS